jgi:hypothetical protein
MKSNFFAKNKYKIIVLCGFAFFIGVKCMSGNNSEANNGSILRLTQEEINKDSHDGTFQSFIGNLCSIEKEKNEDFNIKYYYLHPNSLFNKLNTSSEEYNEFKRKNAILRLRDN